MSGTYIEAIGTALGACVESNAALRGEYPEWDFDRLEVRTGVTQRHIAAPGQTALDLGGEACATLFERAGAAAGDFDALLSCTQTPDHLIPGNAALLHHRIGMPSAAMAIDVNMGCSAYPHLLALADGLLKAGSAQRVLVVTADTYSRFIRPDDRATRILFGDGAAATALSAAPAAAPGPALVDVMFGADGGRHDRFWIEAGGARAPAGDPAAAHISMNGIGVLSFFNSRIPDFVRALLERNGLAIGDVDRFVFHQASGAALDGLQRAMGIAPQRLVRAFADTGNLVSASIPVALQRAVDDGTVRPGQHLLLCGFGVGLSWSAALLRW